MKGVINKDSSVTGKDTIIYQLPVRGVDNEGYNEVLIDAKDIGGSGEFQRKSVKPFIGMSVEFVPRGKGYNFKILKPTK